MAIFGLALVGSACAASSRNMFGGSVSPTLPPTIKTINERNRIAPVPRSAQRPPARSTTWPRVKSNQPTIGPPKAAPRPPLPRASAPATPPRRSGCTEPSGAALSGGCESSCASSYRRRRAGAPRPIGWRRRHSCFVEPRAFGRRSCRTRQCGQHCGSDRSRRRQWLCGFKLRRSAVKAGLKPLFGRCKRNTRTSLTATNRSFVAPISAPRGSIIGLLSAPRSL
jgi:hypothetical protein